MYNNTDFSRIITAILYISPFFISYLSRFLCYLIYIFFAIIHLQSPSLIVSSPFITIPYHHLKSLGTDSNPSLLSNVVRSLGLTSNLVSSTTESGEVETTADGVDLVTLVDDDELSLLVEEVRG